MVFSLAYVGLEVKQNTAAVQPNTHVSLVEYGRNRAEDLVANPDLAALAARAEAAPSTPTKLEKCRLVEFTTWMMVAWEASLLRRKAGLMNDKL